MAKKGIASISDSTDQGQNGEIPEAVFNTAVYFKNAYEDAWITNPVARQRILDIGKSAVLRMHCAGWPRMGRAAFHDEGQHRFH